MNRAQHLRSLALLTLSGLVGTWLVWSYFEPPITRSLLPLGVEVFIAKAAPLIIEAGLSRFWLDMVGVGLTIPTTYLAGMVLQKTFEKRSAVSLYAGLPVGLVVGVLHGLYSGMIIGMVAGTVTGLMFVVLTNMPFAALFAPFFAAIIFAVIPTNVFAGWILFVFILLLYTVALLLGNSLRWLCQRTTHCVSRKREPALAPKSC